MDAKITKKRLSLLLSYDWIKILCICLCAILLWMLIFTMTATRPTNGQKFEIYVYNGVRLDSNELGDLPRLKNKKALSDGILELSTYALDKQGMEDIVLTAHFAAEQGDVMFAANTPALVDKDGNKTLTGLVDFVTRYRSNVVWLGEDNYSEGGQVVYEKSYFTECKEYLGEFFRNEGGQPDWENGTLDKEVAEQRFRERAHTDKRYRKKAVLEQGLELEYERLTLLRDSFVKINEWTHNESKDDPIELCESVLELKTEEGKDVTANVIYAFDLSNIKNIMKVAANTSGETKTSENVCMTVLYNGSYKEKDLFFEPIMFLNYLASNYSA